MGQMVVIWLFVLVLFLGMLLMLEIGRRIRTRQHAPHVDGAGAGLGAVEGAVFALLGLLIAFTFSGAALRFDERRSLIVEEANDIGTAYLRLDLLPPAAQPALREKFREHTDARLSSYRAFLDLDRVRAEQQRALSFQAGIWREAVCASQQSETSSAAMLLLPALNAMIEIMTTRSAALEMHPPVVIFALLGGVALATSLFAGSGMAGAPRPARFTSSASRRS